MAETQVVEAPERSKGKKKPSAQPDRPELKNKSLTFFQRLAKIPKEDWGTRAKLRIYRIEPIIDRLRGSQTKYITIYEEPINEEKIKVDHGSGRYRIYLNFKQPSQEDQAKSIPWRLDILDLNFPPKVPAGDWVDDARNKKWAWAAPKGVTITDTNNQSGGVREFVETIQAVRSLDPPKTEAPPQKSAASDVLDTIRAVKELTPAPPVATDNAMLAGMFGMMQKQSETMAALIAAQLQSGQAETTALRAELKELRNKPADGSGLSAIKELFTEVKTFLPVLKDTFPGATEIMGGGLAVRGRGRPQWWETVLESPVVADALKPIGQALGAMMVANATRAPQQPRGTPPVQQPNPAQQIEAQPQPAQPEQRPVGMIDFVFVNRVPLLKHFAMWCDQPTKTPRNPGPVKASHSG